MADVVISEFMDQAAVDDLGHDFDVRYEPDLVDRPGDLLDAVADARALIVRNRTQVRGALLHTAGRLRVVGRLGVGLDNIDLQACAERNVAVLPATGANDAAVAEYVIATAMLLLRNAFMMNGPLMAGAWPRQQCIGREIGAKHLGLIGFGAIARETARRAQALGMQVMAHDPYVDPDDPVWDGVQRVVLPDLLEQADVVSLHLPLTETTRGLLDASLVGRMKRGAVLVNTARGGIVDERAVAKALTTGQLAGAALDVFEIEPLTADAAIRFAEAPNLILTPHIAGVTKESNVRVSAVTAANVRRALLAR